MFVWSSLEDFKSYSGSNPHNLSIVIGNFDGVHKGHQKLISEALKVANKHASRLILFTFEPHPVQVLYPEKNHVRLFSLKDQVEQLKQRGVFGVYRQSFSREFSHLPAEKFLTELLMKNFHPKSISVGEGFIFGAHRKGDRQLLAETCERLGVELNLVSEQVNLEGEIISTSLIRKRLQQGRVEGISEMLGRRYYLQGIVEKGEGRGRTLGFPTANIRPEVDFSPKLGVYVCKTVIKDMHVEKSHWGVINIGINKTFVEGDRSPLKFEVHLLNFSQDLYGRILKVELLDYLREEMKFDGKDSLVAQIAKDIQNAGLHIKKYGENEN